MWLLIFIYGMVTLFVGWSMFGYFITVWFMGRIARRKEAPFPGEWPSITVIIPCYNEEADISSKIANVKELDYPKDKMEVIFADGGSSDKTLEVLEREKAPSWRILKCARKGKVNQLNESISISSAKLIVNTDCDAILEPDCLKWLAAEFAADPNVYVAGAYCRPSNAMPVESYYWSSQNKARFMENDYWTSSIVIAPCYAFRRELMDSFPADVVADDIYVAMTANSAGFRTVYSRKAKAVETRNPQCYAEFIPHKFRKSNAYLRETLRFIYRLPDMNMFCKTMVLTRLAQQLLLPWSALAWLLTTGSLLTLFRWDMVVLSSAFLFALLIGTHLVFMWTRLPSKPEKGSILAWGYWYVLTYIILILTALSYPFFRQGSSYSRLTG